MNEHPTSSRILTDVPCKVCHDNSSGKHYGIFACDGCAGFFKRSIRRNRQYICKNNGLGNCPVDKTHRNQCRSCRLTRCLEAGMNKEAVQHERGPRNSTIRKQMALLLRESNELINSYHFHQYQTLSKSSFIDQYEIAAKILFNTVNWIKTIPAFVSLSNHDQFILLEDRWKDLFLLTAIEEKFQINFNEIIHLNRKYEIYKSDIENFQEILNKFSLIKIDSNELIFLKNFLLFKISLNQNVQLMDYNTINYLHNQSQLLLNTYIIKQYPSEENRFWKFLLLISSFQSISSLAIEDIFFRKTIGDQTHMEQLVKDIYKMITH